MQPVGSMVTLLAQEWPCLSRPHSTQHEGMKTRLHASRHSRCSATICPGCELEPITTRTRTF